jgi:hypothetical protein
MHEPMEKRAPAVHLLAFLGMKHERPAGAIFECTAYCVKCMWFAELTVTTSIYIANNAGGTLLIMHDSPKIVI